MAAAVKFLLIVLTTVWCLGALSRRFASTH